MINRDYYLNQLIEKQRSSKVKINIGLEGLANHIYSANSIAHFRIAEFFSFIFQK